MTSVLIMIKLHLGFNIVFVTLVGIGELRRERKRVRVLRALELGPEDERSDAVFYALLKS